MTKTKLRECKNFIFYENNNGNINNFKCRVLEMKCKNCDHITQKANYISKEICPCCNKEMKKKLCGFENRYIEFDLNENIFNKIMKKIKQLDLNISLLSGLTFERIEKDFNSPYKKLTFLSLHRYFLRLKDTDKKNYFILSVSREKSIYNDCYDLINSIRKRMTIKEFLNL